MNKKANLYQKYISSDLIFYAPNVHVGGGLVLLINLLKNIPHNIRIIAILDERAKEIIEIKCLDKLNEYYWIKPTIGSRVFAEILVARYAKKNTPIFCFHNIPPILSKSKKVIIFFQNRLIIEPLISKQKTTQIQKLTLLIEKIVIRLFYWKVIAYICQTESVKNNLMHWLQNSCLLKIKISSEKFHVLNFYDNEALLNNTYISEIKKWEFIYVSSGGKHKNHKNLLLAWEILSNEGINPTLAVTIDFNYAFLCNEIKNLSKTIKVVNLGRLHHSEVLNAYKDSNALIFPSRIETVGLPLLEAKILKMPILASEKDFVRDICDPVETFDPESPLSIARAVKRFLKYPIVISTVLTPGIFWNKLIELTR